jgi:hypothetical protein
MPRWKTIGYQDDVDPECTEKTAHSIGKLLI